MKRAQDINLNTKHYWNNLYKEREKYLTEQTGITQRFNQTLLEVNDGDKFVDIGCGVGAMTRLLKNNKPTCEVWGTDISDEVIKTNKKERKDIVYHHQYIGRQDKLPTKYFDVVFAGEVLEHLDNPNDLFLDASRILKPGGKFIITTPLRDAIKSPEHIFEFDYPDIEQLYLENKFTRPRFVYLPDMEHLHIIYAVGKRL